MSFPDRARIGGYLRHDVGVELFYILFNYYYYFLNVAHLLFCFPEIPQV